MRFLAFLPFFGRFWPILAETLKKWDFRPKIGQKTAKKLKISKIQKTSFVCILKCHFHAKNGLQWVNWKRVLLFRSKFSDPQNPRISYTFRKKKLGYTANFDKSSWQQKKNSIPWKAFISPLSKYEWQWMAVNGSPWELRESSKSTKFCPKTAYFLQSQNLNFQSWV